MTLQDFTNQASVDFSTKLCTDLIRLIVEQVASHAQSHSVDNVVATDKLTIEALTNLLAAGKVTTSKKVRKTRTKKGPSKTSAWQQFCAAKRAEVVAENSGIKASAVLSELGSRWRGMSDLDKKEFQIIADKKNETVSQVELHAQQDEALQQLDDLIN